MSKIFEKLLCKQVTVLADENLSKHHCDFRKAFSAQYSLVAMLGDGKVWLTTRKYLEHF